MAAVSTCTSTPRLLHRELDHQRTTVVLTNLGYSGNAAPAATITSPQGREPAGSKAPPASLATADGCDCATGATGCDRCDRRDRCDGATVDRCTGYSRRHRPTVTVFKALLARRVRRVPQARSVPQADRSDGATGPTGAQGFQALRARPCDRRDVPPVQRCAGIQVTGPTARRVFKRHRSDSAQGPMPDRSTGRRPTGATGATGATVPRHRRLHHHDRTSPSPRELDVSVSWSRPAGCRRSYLYVNTAATTP